MSKPALIDNWGRPITYLRLAVTDRCNLRCFYCMPEEGINYLPKEELLTYEEMERLIKIFCELGIEKVRITGGEPLVRRDLAPFLKRLRTNTGLRELHMTTNGVLTRKYIPELVELGMDSINLSLDTLDKNRFKAITRRDEFETVYQTLEELIDRNIPTKINMVVMAGKNTEDIVPMANLTKIANISVRYIEEMPFNGEEQHQFLWSHQHILEHLKDAFPDLTKIDDPDFATATHYQLPEAQGNIGIIAAYSRTFCGTCNRIRLTAQGELRTCLYAKKGIDLRSLIRSGRTDISIANTIVEAINSRHSTGFEAEKERTNTAQWESMSTIGG